jgi:outer membrane cobalamin receptor
VQFEDVDQDGAPDLIVATGVTGITRDPAVGADAPQPLIVIDGVIQSADVPLSDLDELSIDHVEIVKGAEALRLYGDRARDGVIQITTKDGGTP